LVGQCSCGAKNDDLFISSSPQGIGKSIIVRFLANHVIGKELYHPYSEVSSFLRFNGSLAGKLLVVFEEVPSSDHYEWKLFTDRLKYFLTEDIIDIEEKFKNKRFVKNTVSFMIITNNYRAVKLTPDDRRFFMPDVVNFKETEEYYNVLYKYTNEPIVGKHFICSVRNMLIIIKILTSSGCP
jgi:hypothetical protein